MCTFCLEKFKITEKSKTIHNFKDQKAGKDIVPPVSKYE